MSENKSSYFSIGLPITTNLQPDIYVEKLENKIDLIFHSMKVKSTWYKYMKPDYSEIIYFFKTEDRKRKGQLIKYCDQILDKNQQYKIQPHTKFSFDSSLARIENNPNFNLVHKPIIFSEYNASDIAIFENEKNWYPWQKQIYSHVFGSNGNFKTAHPRHIISLVDRAGNSGKSSFFKWLFYHHPTAIGRIGYGSASQLRSSVVNIGKKELYVVDLARSKSKTDRQEDLLSVLEDLKSGLVTNAMYGSGKTLIMEPPHIIVSSNYVLNYELLSKDRWEVYEITSKNTLNKLREKDLVQKKKIPIAKK